VSWRPRSFVERIGAALADPRAALAAADDPDNAGRTGTDAALLLIFAVIALHTREVVVSVWLGAVDSVGSGANALLALVGRSVGTDLVLILVAGVLVTIAAGRRRSVGRDFDLACVAYVPFVFVQLLAYLILGLAHVRLSRALTDAVGAVAFGWAALVVLLAVLHARKRSEPSDG